MPEGTHVQALGGMSRTVPPHARHLEPNAPMVERVLVEVSHRTPPIVIVRVGALSCDSPVSCAGQIVAFDIFDEMERAEVVMRCRRAAVLQVTKAASEAKAARHTILIPARVNNVPIADAGDDTLVLIDDVNVSARVEGQGKVSHGSVCG